MIRSVTVACADVSRGLPAVTVLPFDTDVAQAYGRLGAALARAGIRLADADLQTAATALRHDLEHVTGNLRRQHVGRTPRRRQGAHRRLRPRPGTDHSDRRSITVGELQAADEVLNTGSVRGVVPITAIDDRPVGDGTVGPHARALFTAFAAHVASYVAARRGGVVTGTG